jgi:hypothetical protein
MRYDAPADLIPPGVPERFEAGLEPRIDLRIGDAERDMAMTLLREHFAAGRITLDELTERIDGALAARTQRHIDSLLVDLPPLPADIITTAPGDSLADQDAGRYVVLLLLLFALAAWLIAMLYMASAGGYGGPPS